MNEADFREVSSKIKEYNSEELHNKEDFNLARSKYADEGPLLQPEVLILPELSRREKIGATITGIAAGSLSYDVLPFMHPNSARITMAAILGIGATIVDGFYIPLIEANRSRR